MGFRLGLLMLLAAQLPAQVRLVRNGEQVDVSINGNLCTSFHFGADAPKPYFYPLRSPTGVNLTRGFPMEIVEGEGTTDPHHRGMWYTHGNVNGVSFWEEGPGKGKIVLRTLGRLRNGEVGSFTADLEWQAPDGAAIMQESQTASFTLIGNEYLIDIEAVFKPAGNEKVVFGDTKNGSFSIHVVKGLSEMINSEGGKNEKEIWGKRADWVDFTGIAEGQKWGIAMFDHARNPKHPAYWHARANGLLAINQFGEHDFYGDPSRNGSVTIEPGASLTFRYRVVIHPGDPGAARIANQYRLWAEKAP